MNILITGGAGYIGSHTAIELLAKNNQVLIIDNLLNSNPDVIRRIEKISQKSITFHKLDLRDKPTLVDIFRKNKIDAVIHFAGLKAVGESVVKPLEYYDNNIISTITLLEVMEQFRVNKIVFSSSATVYGEPGTPKYIETLPAGHNISNPYGRTKYIIEEILRDSTHANPNLQVSILRYFNPIGAHESGLIGEDPQGIPNNLMPFITQVATKKREKLYIFGDDYSTADGTCRRDYIHVVDLARGHLAALEYLKPGVTVYNLGSGKPTSVLELVATFIKVTGVDVPYEFAPKRAGDLAEFYADPSKALKELSWKTEKTIEDMCRDSWRFASRNYVK